MVVLSGSKETMNSSGQRIAGLLVVSQPAQKLSNVEHSGLLLTAYTASVDSRDRSSYR